MSEHENSIDIDGLCCTECFYQGRIAERERIISLLGTCPCNCPASGCECGCGEEPEFTRNELISLIKGENE